MLCIEFNRPEAAEYAEKRKAAIHILKQIIACVEATPESVAVTKSADRDVVGLACEIANQISHDFDIIKFLDW